MSEHYQFKDRLLGMDFVILATTLLLVAAGLFLIYSADHSRGVTSHFNKQLWFSLIGLTLLLIIVFIPPKALYASSFIIYGVAITLLILVPILGIIGLGAKRWLIIGGVQVQPSEPAKLALILCLARLLAYRDQQASSTKYMIVASALTILPMGLVLSQPDLGTSIVFPIIALTMLIWFGVQFWLIVAGSMVAIAAFVTVKPIVIVPILVLGLLALWRLKLRIRSLVTIAVVCTIMTLSANIAWHELEPYQQKRLTTFLNPSADPLGSGYQVIQSKVAVGSGGILGQGYLRGTQTQLRFLPEQHTDFIFALAAEEFGFVGASFILICYLIIAWRSIHLASRVKNQFMSLTIVGMTAIIIAHVLINIGMVVGLLPVTGLPLPFLSYGGSFLLTCLMTIGIILSISLYQRER